MSSHYNSVELKTHNSTVITQTFPGAVSRRPRSAHASLKQLSAVALHLCEGMARTHPAHHL